MKRVVLIPVETISRELDYKLVLASKLADEETTCIIGQHNYLNKIFKYFKEGGGVYFGKNVFPDMVPCTQEHYQHLKENNFSLLYHHEEGGVFFGSENDWVNRLKSQLDPNILQNDDAILCWGEFQANHYKSLALPFSTYKVGSPRLDIEPGSDLFEITSQFSRVKHDKFILINTNFSVVNHMMGLTAELKYFKSRKFDDSDALTNINLWYSAVFEIMGNFLKMIVILASNNPNQTFVIRPHPTESLEIYEYLQSVYSNITVSKSYNAVNWISKCKLVIQNNCTTSLEAFFMNVPVVNFLQERNNFSVNILDDIGHHIKDTEEIQRLILDHNIQSKDNLSEDSKLRVLIDNFIDSGSSINKISNIINSYLQNKKKVKIPIFWIQATYYKTKIRNALAYLPRFLFPSKLRSYRMYNSHFQGFEKKEILLKVDFLSKKNNKTLKTHFLNKELFIITS